MCPIDNKTSILTRRGIRIFAAFMLLALPAAVRSAGPEILLREEPEKYLIIDKLQGLGMLPDIMTGDRGLEAKEVSREVKKVEEFRCDPFVDLMVRFLQLDSENKFDFRLRGGFEYSEDGRSPPNEQGLPVLKDGGVRIGGFFRYAPAEWVGLQGRGDFLAGPDDRLGRLEETSLRLGWPQVTLEAGKFSPWWGPGRHGALIFTTNAEALNGIRLRNPRPISLGSPLRFLGLIQYDFFIAQLDAARPIPHTLLSGMRVAIRPNRYLEIGASRAIHFGGKGQGKGLSDWWRAFQGTHDNDPGTTGNQIAGFDVQLTLPFKIQPVHVYWEGAGEDEAAMIGGVPFPSKWAFLYGVFLPSLFGTPRLDFRAEIALNHLGGSGPSWYVHPFSPHMYRGRILGHHMGTNAQDFFFEGHYFLIPSSYLEMNLDLTRRYSPGPAREDTQRITTAVVAWLTRNVRAEGRLVFNKVKNENGRAGADSREVQIQLIAAYHYR